MSAATTFLPILLLLGVALLWMNGRAEHRRAMQERARLFDDVARHFADCRVTAGEDSFPALASILPDGRKWKAGIVADSLVPRRLPQLWLKLTLVEKNTYDGPTLGVLARPTGVEFYSMVQGLPERLEPPFEADGPMVMRGRNVRRGDLSRVTGIFRTLLADPALKEAVVTPRGARIVRRIAEGGRGAHMVFRQMRFPVQRVPPSLVATALAEAQHLSEAARRRRAETTREPEPA